MKNINLNSNNKNHFTVDISQINNSKALLPYILFKKMEQFAVFAALPYQEHISSKPTLSKLNILKNAFLNDKLQIKSSVKKLNLNELQLSVEVIKNTNDNNDIICNALFCFSLSEINMNQAS